MAILVVASAVLFGLPTTPITWLGVVIVVATPYTYMNVATKLPKPPAKVAPAAAAAESGLALLEREPEPPKSSPRP